jgi:hypothetical protein
LAVLVTFLFRAWILRFRTPFRLDQIERKKLAAKIRMHEEGIATRARMNYAIQTGSIPPERRVGIPGARTFITIALLFAVAISVTAATGIWPFEQAPPSLDQVISNLNVGDCTNFTNNYSGGLPSHPLIVPCSNPDATFVVRWAGARASNNCPDNYPLLDSWQDNAGKVACMARVYKAGQCMQGKRDGRYIEWFGDAVVSCRAKLTEKYPYIVTIVKIVSKTSADCPRHSTVDRRSRANLCIERLRGPRR